MLPEGCEASPAAATSVSAAPLHKRGIDSRYIRVDGDTGYSESTKRHVFHTVMYSNALSVSDIYRQVSGIRQIALSMWRS